MRAFGICVAISIVAALAIILGSLSALGIEITDEVVIGLTMLVVPLSLMSGALMVQFKTINIYAGAVLCSVVTLVGTILLALLASGLK